jgi:hypothetical protein
VVKIKLFERGIKGESGAKQPRPDDTVKGS